MSFKSLVFAYLIALSVVTAMALLAPIVGIAAGLFSIGHSAWTNNWAPAPYAAIGIVMWSIATQHPWPIIIITAIIGLFSYVRVYNSSRLDSPLV